jgi:hypothetical protein
MAQRTWALPSLRLKYQWPEEGAAKLLISPSTQTKSKWLSSSVLACRLSWLTVRVSGVASLSNGVEMRELPELWFT